MCRAKNYSSVMVKADDPGLMNSFCTPTEQEQLGEI